MICRSSPPSGCCRPASSSSLLLVGIYFLFPKLVGVGDGISQTRRRRPGLDRRSRSSSSIASYATYIALFKAVVGGDALKLSWGETYEINMAGVAATLLFSAGGAGGVALTYWALRKAGMERRDVARRMIAFVSLHYAFYPFALIVFGLLLRTGVLHGSRLGRADDHPRRGRGPPAGRSARW